MSSFIRARRAFFLVVVCLPLFASAQPEALSDHELRLRTIKGLQLRTSKLLSMAGREDAFMSAYGEEAGTLSRETYKTPGELASAPDAEKSYATALKLNRIADDMIAGGKGDTNLNPWKRSTPEDLAERIRFTYDFCEEQQKCLQDEMEDVEKVIGWMQKQVEGGKITVPDFVDMACDMIDRFHRAVTVLPLPEATFLKLNRIPDKKLARMLEVRTRKLMQLTFQKRAFYHAASREIGQFDALVERLKKEGDSPALRKAFDAATMRLIAIADDILAGSDGTTRKKPWKRYTPEDLSERTKQLDPFSDHTSDFTALDDNFRKMALQVNAGNMSVGDFIDNMCLGIDNLIAGQNRRAKSATEKKRH